jgi:hypothetical protein
MITKFSLKEETMKSCLNVFLKFGMILILTLFTSNQLFAENSSVSVESGSISGTQKYSNDNPSYSSLNTDYTLEGSSLSLVYTKTRDNGLIVGGGYHSYEVSGEETWNGYYYYQGYTFDTSVKFKTNSLKLSGLFGLAGYDVRITDQFSFQPHIRLGIANQIEWKQTVVITVSYGGESASTSGSFSESDSVMPLIIVLPISFKASDFVIGAQYVMSSVGYELTSGVANYESGFVSGISLSAGYMF